MKKKKEKEKKAIFFLIYRKASDHLSEILHSIFKSILMWTWLKWPFSPSKLIKVSKRQRESHKITSKNILVVLIKKSLSTLGFILLHGNKNRPEERCSIWNSKAEIQAKLSCNQWDFDRVDAQLRKPAVPKKPSALLKLLLF